MNIKKILIGVSASAILLASTAIPVFAVGSNGSFETGTLIDPSFTTLTAVDGASITDWTVDSGSIDYIGTYWTASLGVRSLDLNGLAKGSISQTLTTVVGATYNVTFDLSGNPDSRPAEDPLFSPSIKDLRVSATGAISQDFNFDTSVELNDKSNMKWKSEAYSFVATGTSTTLTFASQIPGAFGPALDNVVITETLPAVLAGKATGGIRLSNPKQQVSFEAFDYGESNLDKGSVEYSNFDFPGGLHYNADIICAKVNKTTSTVWFAYQIPDGHPGLSGLGIEVQIQDIGTPGTKGDTFGFNVAANGPSAVSLCEAGTPPVNSYTITGGNAVVHK